MNEIKDQCIWCEYYSDPGYTTGPTITDEYPYCMHEKVDEDVIGSLAFDYMNGRKKCPYRIDISDVYNFGEEE